MKIYGNQPPEVNCNNCSTDKVKGAKSKENISAEGEVKPGDKVEISSRAKELAALINQLPEVRTDKVEAIKDAIESGEYKVDPLKVANRIIEEI